MAVNLLHSAFYIPVLVVVQFPDELLQLILVLFCYFFLAVQVLLRLYSLGIILTYGWIDPLG